ncbi:MAG TPA: hypothetical protein VNI20_04295 [Fimbriimonadaceae bacterium]|nr:hypothetical protein [Fimbriimonadaceae bacterium]
MRNAEVAPLLPFVNAFLDENSLGEFARMVAKSASVTGSVNVMYTKANGLQVGGDARLVAKGLESQQTFHSGDADVDVKSDGTVARVTGTVRQNGFIANVDASTQVHGPFRFVGDVDAHSDCRDTLPPQIKPFVDPAVAFSNADYHGTIDTDGETVTLAGSLRADNIQYAGETVSGVDSQVRLDSDKFVAQLDEATWAGVGYSGAVSVDLATGKLDGNLQSQRGRLEPIAEHFGTDRVKGIVSVFAVLKGTYDVPIAEVYARGSGGVRVGSEDNLVSLGVFEMRGRLDQEGAHLDRLEVNGQNGLLVADGSMKWDGSVLDFKVNGGGLDLHSASKKVEGLGFVKANITGTREAPSANGRIEIYGLKAFDRAVPQLVVDWSADGDHLSFDRFAARAGTGKVDGHATLDFKSNGLDGEFNGSGVRLEEWLSKDTVGSVAVQDGRIGGTLDDPTASARVVTGPLYAAGAEINSIEAQVTADKTAIKSNDFTVSLGGGTVKGSADYGLDKKAGSLNAKLADLPLSEIPLQDYSLALDGLANGSLSLGYDETGLTSGALDVDVQEVKVNDTSVGRGSLSAQYADNDIVANAQVGSLERYILLSDAKYNTKTKEVGGQAIVYNLLLQDIAQAVKKPIANWPSEAQRILLESQGLVNASVTVSGDATDPTITVDSFDMTDLSLDGREGGRLNSSGSRKGGVWNIDKFEWRYRNSDEQPTFWMKGTAGEDGGFTVNGAMEGFDASWMHTLFPGFPLLAGSLDIPEYSFSGTVDDPTGYAKFSAENLNYFNGAEVVNVKGRLANGRVDVADRMMDVKGDIEASGFKGVLLGNVPFTSLYEPEDGSRQPMNLQVDLSPTKFSAFAPYWDGIDAERSKGTVSGSAWLVGLWGDFSVYGEMSAKGESFAMKGQETALQDIDLSARMNEWATTVHGTVGSSTGGKATVDLSAQSPDMLAQTISGDQFKSQTTLDGKVLLDNLGLAFTLPFAERASHATVNTKDFKISGTLAAPKLSGNIDLKNVYVRLPDQLSESREAIVYPIDPVFDGVTVRAAEGSRLDSGNARIQFFGAGRLDGSLQNPDVTMPLSVTGGVFELPTARITLESGGAINVGYRSTLGLAPSARVDLNLEGRTSVSARSTEGRYERYDVHLNIRGDLLSEEGLDIVASSDPPDLTSDQIMAVLGQKDLIEGFARSGSQQDLRNQVYSAALPAAANLVTGSLARELALDYITLDYNPIDLTVAGVGKTITKGLTLHADRQLESTAGQRIKYQIELTYRLPLEDRFFSRIRLGFGFDQDVPWRFRLGWARRF